MANRVTVPVTNFEVLSPPWSLNSLDQDFLAVQGALNDASLGYVTTGTDTGSANHYNIPTPTFGMPSSYQAGMTVLLIPANTNSSGACNISVGGLGFQAIQSAGGGNVPIGWLGINKPCLLVYTGTAFQLVTTGAFPVVVNNNNPAATVNVGCLYASSVVVSLAFPNPTTTFLNLNQLPDGVPVSVNLTNSSGGAVIYRVLANDPFANTTNVFMAFPTSAAGAPQVNVGGVSQTLAAGSMLTLTGIQGGGYLFLNT